MTRTGRRPTPQYITVTTLLYLSAIGIAASAFWPVYESQRLVVLIVVSALSGSALAIAGALLRLPAALLTLGGVALYLLLGVPLAVPDRAASGWLPTTGGLSDLLAGTALSWKQLLTVTLPAGSFRALLVPPFLVVLGTVIAGLSIALRARRAGLAALGPLLVLMTAIVLGPRSGVEPVPVALALAAVLLAWLAWLRWYRRSAVVSASGSAAVGGRVLRPRRPRSARAMGGGVVLIAVAIVGAASATTIAAPGAPRAVLRAAVVQPFDPRAYPSPLSGFRGYLEPPASASTMLTVTGLPAGARVRIATLDRYDGVVYSVGSGAADRASGTFTMVPFRFDQSAVSGRKVTVRVVVGDYSGVWLPTVGSLESAAFSGDRATALRDGFVYNDGLGTAADVGGVGSGDSYVLSAVLPDQPTASQLASLTPGTAAVPGSALVPAGLVSSVAGFVGQTSGAGARLQAALAGLRSTGFLSHGIAADAPPSRSGHSADRISQLLTRPQLIGDDEQYAVAGALMARQLGFPARVVLGFRAPPVSPAPVSPASGSPASVSTGSTVLTGADIGAWLEVDTASFGWVALDATPAPRDIPAGTPDTPTLVTRPEAPVPPPVVTPADPAAQVPPNSVPDTPVRPDPALAILLVVLTAGGWLLLAIAVLLTPFAAVIAIKLRRRRARRRGSPLARISGGWREFEDAAIDHGVVAPAAGTRAEFAAVVGGRAPALLADAADRAIFAPSAPLPADADEVWLAVAGLASGLDAGLTRRQRWRARVSLRSVRRSRS